MTIKPAEDASNFSFDPDNDGAVVIFVRDLRGKDPLGEPLEIQILNIDPIFAISWLAATQQTLVLNLVNHVKEQRASAELQRLLDSAQAVDAPRLITEH